MGREFVFFDPLGEFDEDVEGVSLEAGGLAAVEGGDVVHDGLRGEGGGFVGAAAAAFVGDAAEAAPALPLVVASGVELLECWEVVIWVGFVGVDFSDGGV